MNSSTSYLASDDGRCSLAEQKLDQGRGHQPDVPDGARQLRAVRQISEDRERRAAGTCTASRLV
jgi:hypothetical protein